MKTGGQAQLTKGVGISGGGGQTAGKKKQEEINEEPVEDLNNGWTFKIWIRREKKKIPKPPKPSSTSPHGARYDAGYDSLSDFYDSDASKLSGGATSRKLYGKEKAKYGGKPPGGKGKGKRRWKRKDGGSSDSDFGIQTSNQQGFVNPQPSKPILRGGVAELLLGLGGPKVLQIEGKNQVTLPDSKQPSQQTSRSVSRQPSEKKSVSRQPSEGESPKSASKSSSRRGSDTGKRNKNRSDRTGEFRNILDNPSVLGLKTDAKHDIFLAKVQNLQKQREKYYSSGDSENDELFNKQNKPPKMGRLDAGGRDTKGGDGKYRDDKYGNSNDAKQKTGTGGYRDDKRRDRSEKEQRTGKLRMSRKSLSYKDSFHMLDDAKYPDLDVKLSFRQTRAEWHLGSVADWEFDRVENTIYFPELDSNFLRRFVEDGVLELSVTKEEASPENENEEEAGVAGSGTGTIGGTAVAVAAKRKKKDQEEEDVKDSLKDAKLIDTKMKEGDHRELQKMKEGDHKEVQKEDYKDTKDKEVKMRSAKSQARSSIPERFKRASIQTPDNKSTDGQSDIKGDKSTGDNKGDKRTDNNKKSDSKNEKNTDLKKSEKDTDKHKSSTEKKNTAANTTANAAGGNIGNNTGMISASVVRSVSTLNDQMDPRSVNENEGLLMGFTAEGHPIYSDYLQYIKSIEQSYGYGTKRITLELQPLLIMDPTRDSRGFLKSEIQERRKAWFVNVEKEMMELRCRLLYGNDGFFKANCGYGSGYPGGYGYGSGCVGFSQRGSQTMDPLSGSPQLKNMVHTATEKQVGAAQTIKKLADYSGQLRSDAGEDHHHQGTKDGVKSEGGKSDGGKSDSHSGKPDTGDHIKKADGDHKPSVHKAGGTAKTRVAPSIYQNRKSFRKSSEPLDAAHLRPKTAETINRGGPSSPPNSKRNTDDLAVMLSMYNQRTAVVNTLFAKERKKAVASRAQQSLLELQQLGSTKAQGSGLRKSRKSRMGLDTDGVAKDMKDGTKAVGAGTKKSQHDADGKVDVKSGEKGAKGGGKGSAGGKGGVASGDGAIITRGDDSASPNRPGGVAGVTGGLAAATGGVGGAAGATGGAAGAAGNAPGAHRVTQFGGATIGSGIGAGALGGTAGFASNVFGSMSLLGVEIPLTQVDNIVTVQKVVKRVDKVWEMIVSKLHEQVEEKLETMKQNVMYGTKELFLSSTVEIEPTTSMKFASNRATKPNYKDDVKGDSKLDQSLDKSPVPTNKDQQSPNQNREGQHAAAVGNNSIKEHGNPELPGGAPPGGTGRNHDSVTFTLPSTDDEQRKGGTDKRGREMEENHANGGTKGAGKFAAGAGLLGKNIPTSAMQKEQQKKEDAKREMEQLQNKAQRELLARLEEEEQKRLQLLKEKLEAVERKNLICRIQSEKVEIFGVYFEFGVELSRPMSHAKSHADLNPFVVKINPSINDKTAKDRKRELQQQHQLQQQKQDHDHREVGFDSFTAVGNTGGGDTNSTYQIVASKKKEKKKHGNFQGISGGGLLVHPVIVQNIDVRTGLNTYSDPHNPNSLESIAEDRIDRIELSLCGEQRILNHDNYCAVWFLGDMERINYQHFGPHWSQNLKVKDTLKSGADNLIGIMPPKFKYRGDDNYGKASSFRAKLGLSEDSMNHSAVYTSTSHHGEFAQGGGVDPNKSTLSRSGTSMLAQLKSASPLIGDSSLNLGTGFTGVAKGGFPTAVPDAGERAVGKGGKAGFGGKGGPGGTAPAGKGDGKSVGKSGGKTGDSTGTSAGASTVGKGKPRPHAAFEDVEDEKDTTDKGFRKDGEDTKDGLLLVKTRDDGKNGKDSPKEFHEKKRKRKSGKDDLKTSSTQSVIQPVPVVKKIDPIQSLIDNRAKKTHNIQLNTALEALKEKKPMNTRKIPIIMDDPSEDPSEDPYDPERLQLLMERSPIGTGKRKRREYFSSLEEMFLTKKMHIRVFLKNKYGVGSIGFPEMARGRGPFTAVSLLFPPPQRIDGTGALTIDRAISAFDKLSSKLSSTGSENIMQSPTTFLALQTTKEQQERLRIEQEQFEKQQQDTVEGLKDGRKDGGKDGGKDGRKDGAKDDGIKRKIMAKAEKTDSKEDRKSKEGRNDGRLHCNNWDGLPPYAFGTTEMNNFSQECDDGMNSGSENEYCAHLLKHKTSVEIDDNKEILIEFGLGHPLNKKGKGYDKKGYCKRSIVPEMDLSLVTTTGRNTGKNYIGGVEGVLSIIPKEEVVVQTTLDPQQPPEGKGKGTTREDMKETGVSSRDIITINLLVQNPQLELMRKEFGFDDKAFKKRDSNNYNLSNATNLGVQSGELSDHDNDESTDHSDNKLEMKREMNSNKTGVFSKVVIVLGFRKITLMKKIISLIRIHNAEVFKISRGEVGTRQLTNAEKISGNIDYLSGFVLIDCKHKIVVIEGLHPDYVQKLAENGNLANSSFENKSFHQTLEVKSGLSILLEILSNTENHLGHQNKPLKKKVMKKGGRRKGHDGDGHAGDDGGDDIFYDADGGSSATGTVVVGGGSSFKSGANGTTTKYYYYGGETTTTHGGRTTKNSYSVVASSNRNLNDLELTKGAKILYHSNVRYGRRQYADFDITLKQIKLRKRLEVLLTKIDVYHTKSRSDEVALRTMEKLFYMKYAKRLCDLKAFSHISSSNIIGMEGVFPHAADLLKLEALYGRFVADVEIDGGALTRKMEKKLYSKDEYGGELLTGGANSSKQQQESESSQTGGGESAIVGEDTTRILQGGQNHSDQGIMSHPQTNQINDNTHHVADRDKHHGDDAEKETESDSMQLLRSSNQKQRASVIMMQHSKKMRTVPKMRYDPLPIARGEVGRQYESRTDMMKRGTFFLAKASAKAMNATNLAKLNRLSGKSGQDRRLQQLGNLGHLFSKSGGRPSNGNQLSNGKGNGGDVKRDGKGGKPKPGQRKKSIKMTANKIYNGRSGFLRGHSQSMDDLSPLVMDIEKGYQKAIVKTSDLNTLGEEFDDYVYGALEFKKKRSAAAILKHKRKKQREDVYTSGALSDYIISGGALSDYTSGGGRKNNTQKFGTTTEMNNAQGRNFDRDDDGSDPGMIHVSVAGDSLYNQDYNTSPTYRGLVLGTSSDSPRKVHRGTTRAKPAGILKGQPRPIGGGYIKKPRYQKNDDGSSFYSNEGDENSDHDEDSDFYSGRRIHMKLKADTDSWNREFIRVLHFRKMIQQNFSNCVNTELEKLIRTKEAGQNERFVIKKLKKEKKKQEKEERETKKREAMRAKTFGTTTDPETFSSSSNTSTSSDDSKNSRRNWKSMKTLKSWSPSSGELYKMQCNRSPEPGTQGSNKKKKEASNNRDGNRDGKKKVALPDEDRFEEQYYRNHKPLQIVPYRENTTGFTEKNLATVREFISTFLETTKVGAEYVEAAKKVESDLMYRNRVEMAKIGKYRFSVADNAIAGFLNTDTVGALEGANCDITGTLNTGTGTLNTGTGTQNSIKNSWKNNTGSASKNSASNNMLSIKSGAGGTGNSDSWQESTGHTGNTGNQSLTGTTVSSILGRRVLPGQVMDLLSDMKNSFLFQGLLRELRSQIDTYWIYQNYQHIKDIQMNFKKPPPAEEMRLDELGRVVKGGPKDVDLRFLPLSMTSSGEYHIYSNQTYSTRAVQLEYLYNTLNYKENYFRSQPGTRDFDPPINLVLGVSNSMSVSGLSTKGTGLCASGGGKQALIDRAVELPEPWEKIKAPETVPLSDHSQLDRRYRGKYWIRHEMPMEKYAREEAEQQAQFEKMQRLKQQVVKGNHKVDKKCLDIGSGIIKKTKQNIVDRGALTDSEDEGGDSTSAGKSKTQCREDTFVVNDAGKTRESVNDGDDDGIPSRKSQISIQETEKVKKDKEYEKGKKDKDTGGKDGNPDLDGDPPDHQHYHHMDGRQSVKFDIDSLSQGKLKPTEPSDDTKKTLQKGSSPRKRKFIVPEEPWRGLFKSMPRLDEKPQVMPVGVGLSGLVAVASLTGGLLSGGSSSEKNLARVSSRTTVLDSDHQKSKANVASNRTTTTRTTLVDRENGEYKTGRDHELRMRRTESVDAYIEKRKKQVTDPKVYEMHPKVDSMHGSFLAEIFRKDKTGISNRYYGGKFGDQLYRQESFFGKLYFQEKIDEEEDAKSKKTNNRIGGSVGGIVGAENTKLGGQVQFTTTPDEARARRPGPGEKKNKQDTFHKTKRVFSHPAISQPKDYLRKQNKDPERLTNMRKYDLTLPWIENPKYVGPCEYRARSPESGWPYVIEKYFRTEPREPPYEIFGTPKWDKRAEQLRKMQMAESSPVSDDSTPKKRKKGVMFESGHSAKQSALLTSPYRAAKRKQAARSGKGLSGGRLSPGHIADGKTPGGRSFSADDLDKLPSEAKKLEQFLKASKVHDTAEQHIWREKVANGEFECWQHEYMPPGSYAPHGGGGGHGGAGDHGGQMPMTHHSTGEHKDGNHHREISPPPAGHGHPPGEGGHGVGQMANGQMAIFRVQSQNAGWQR